MAVTWITLAGVLIALATLLAGLFAGRRRLEGIHVLVNSNLKRVVTRVDQLVKVLKEHGIEIPDDPEDK